ncbi:MAG: hypothetical protein L0241_00180 [Planctomycetia bacterium]|nr:hypothetical protein [Planctomycetia bacterium]
MGTVVRDWNERCSCGSGKKYKNCMKYHDSLREFFYTPAAPRERHQAAPSQRAPTLQPPGKVEQSEPREIETTAEHPFYVYGKGWTSLNQIKPGEWIRSEDGRVQVGAVENTGRWEKVHNFRVADHHTCFVGAPEWGFAVWAHNMYTPQQLAAMRAHPDRQRVLNAILDAHDALPNPTATSTEVMNRVRSGQLEVLFDDTIPPVGGLAPGENPVILGGQGILGNPHLPADQIHSMMLTTVHEGVHHLDVVAGRSLPGAAATVEQRFFTELHAYTAEYELAHGNGLSRLLAPEFLGARHLDDIAIGVLTVESQLAPALTKLPGVEQSVVQRVSAMFPNVPCKTP